MAKFQIETITCDAVEAATLKLKGIPAPEYFVAEAEGTLHLTDVSASNVTTHLTVEENEELLSLLKRVEARVLASNGLSGKQE